MDKQTRELKKQTLAECRQNSVTISQQLIQSKAYAGEQALWVERWIAQQRIPWGAHAMAGLAIAIAILGWLFPRGVG